MTKSGLVRSSLITGAALGLMLIAAGPASAAMCNLTVAGGASVGTQCGANGDSDWGFSPASSGGYAMAAIFQNVAVPGSTPNKDTFLQISSSPTERGFNTNLRPIPIADVSTAVSNPGTHALPIAEVPVVTLSGIDYRQFYLNIGETTNLLSLDQLKIFLGPNGGLGDYTNTAADGKNSGTLTGATLIYNLDTGFCTNPVADPPGGTPCNTWNNAADNFIQLDYNLVGGSHGDLVAYIPDAYFQGASPSLNPYVYLYAQFGNHASSDGGFEEWWVNSPIAPIPQHAVPEPATLVLFGAGLLASVRVLKRRRPQA